jgi:multicomponent Na+:H+ antiporter subunit B
MRSLVLVTATRLLTPLLLLFSLFLLLRGHYEPGGGFVGGLVAASAFSLAAYAQGAGAARRLLRVPPTALIGVGLLVAVASGLLALFQGEPFLEGRWGAVELPVLGKPGTPLLFDAGVYLVVLGTVLAVVLTLLEAEE